MCIEPSTGKATLIVTDNFVEAVDLTEQMGNLGVGPVSIFRTAAELHEAIRAPGAIPWLVIFGIDTAAKGTADAWEAVTRLGCRVVGIDIETESPSLPNLGRLRRPFSSEDVEILLKRLGFPD